MSVLRQLPRKSRIIVAVSAGGDQALDQEPVDGAGDERRLIGEQLDGRAPWAPRRGWWA